MIVHIATYYNAVEVQRADKAIYARFLKPHQVISTCRANGGVRSDLDYVLNHQGCEPCNHMRHHNYRDTEAYQHSICDPLGLPADRSATMGTAANMNHAALVSESYGDLEVVAVVTGGVETNAGRAGDPASVQETADGFIKLAAEKKVPGPGTINIMLFISQPLTTAALTRSIMMATEAKTAALQELNVNSRYSDGPATGTGTDQIIVAANANGGYALSWAGKHSKLGELIGRAVKTAVKETLAKQNGLTPQGQCSVTIHLERFGGKRDVLLKEASQHLTAADMEVFTNNHRGLLRDPVTVAAAASLAHLRDKFNWQILPASCWPEIISGAAAYLACTISQRYDLLVTYRSELAEHIGVPDNDTFIALIGRAMALGFADKWQDESACEETTGSKTKEEMAS